MKKLTHLLTGTMIVLGAAALTVAKVEPKEKQISHTLNREWLNPIEVTDGITIEFEYGTNFQVFVAGNKQVMAQLVSVLESKLLWVTGKHRELPIESVRIKVLAPLFLNLEKQPDFNLHTIINRHDGASARYNEENEFNLC